MKTTERRTELNTWRFLLDQHGTGLSLGYADPGYDHSFWTEVRSYTSLETYNDALFDYEGGAWFFTTFRPAETGDRRYCLHFDGIGGRAEIYVNGQLAGSTMSRYLPFDVDATPFVKPCEENAVAVYVNNTNIAGPDHLTGRPRTEWVLYGGLTHHIWLVEQVLCRVCHTEIRARHDGSALVRVRVENTGVEAFNGTLSIGVEGLPETAASQEISVKGGQTVTAEFATQAASVTPWSPDEPKLYTLTAALSCGEQTVHTAAERFGYRTIEVSGRKILLNGREILFKGANRYDEFAPYGNCAPADKIREDLLEMKRCGMNFIRTHYQQDPIHYEIADEIGILYMLEVPLNWWMPEENESLDNYPNLKAEALDNVERTYENFCNHPCWVVWSTSNECPHSRLACRQMFRALAARMRELQPGRLITNVTCRDILNSDELDYCDFIAVNTYKGCALDNDFNYATEVVAALKEKLAQAETYYPDRPLVITEWGITCVYGLHGNGHEGRFTEELSANYLRTAGSTMASLPQVCGMVIWCWADYRHRHFQMRPTRLTSMHLDATYGPYGLKTADRRTKAPLMDAVCEVYANFRHE